MARWKKQLPRCLKCGRPIPASVSLKGQAAYCSDRCRRANVHTRGSRLKEDEDQPPLETIAERAAEIRAEWDEGERLKRQPVPVLAWTVSLVSVGSI